MTTNSTSVKTAAGLVKASRTAYTQKWSFMALFVCVLFTSVGFAATHDLLPNPPKAETVAIDPKALAAAPAAVTTNPELPTKIEIPAIGLTQSVGNPTTTNVEQLDAALLTGPVRYPTSSKLGEAGNVIIFGHSSYLPIVHNQAFKAFDGIQKLKEGDLIKVTGEGHVYTYAVETVVTANASEDSIPLSVSGSKLTLATCDSFGTKSDRFIVTATLVDTTVLQ
ncbi:MAG TPA: sortase [Candidatus Paceibacterota bacterium]|nr:sortase [Candidatus Paceibacterota bacterium]